MCTGHLSMYPSHMTRMRLVIGPIMSFVLKWMVWPIVVCYWNHLHESLYVKAQQHQSPKLLLHLYCHELI